MVCAPYSDDCLECEAYWYGPIMMVRNCLIASAPVLTSPVLQIVSIEALLGQKSGKPKLGGRFGYSLFFSAGEGKGESGATGGGGSVFIEKGGARGRECVCRESGGGAKYFFSGPKCPPRKVPRIFFRIFVPNFLPNFAPNFPRIFRGVFVLRLP